MSAEETRQRELVECAPTTRGTSVAAHWDMRAGFCFLACAFFACNTLSNDLPIERTVKKPPGATGQEIFRHDTFGDEQQWTDKLRMHEVIAASVTPRVALSVGLKVDATAVPPDVLATADLDSTATTIALIGLDAVVGVKGKVVDGQLVEVGITCALCHSTVDDSVTFGIGNRLDGWANHDLDPGAIISLSPALTDAQRAVYASWGPGIYDPRFNIDGINGPVVIPPAYGLRNVARETYTGDGPISYWNAYVAITQMGGKGDFSEPALGIFVDSNVDLVTSKLPALLDYQLSLLAPPPPAGFFDTAAAARGEVVFSTHCACCHAGSTYTDSPALHAAAETGVDGRYALRSVTKQYRTTPLRGLWQHAPYFHDGSAQTLRAVVDHYDGYLGLELSEADKIDLVEFLKSL
jgi:cytochrome c5